MCFELLENRNGELTRVARIESVSGLDMFAMSQWQGFDDFTDEARQIVRVHATFVLVLWGLGSRNLIRWRVLTKKGVKRFARERIHLELEALRRAPRQLGTSLDELLDFPQYTHPLKPVRVGSPSDPPEYFYATAETRYRYAAKYASGETPPVQTSAPQGSRTPPLH